VNANRLRLGAIAWLLTLQFFVVETIAQSRWPVPYSRVHRVISDLGTALSPAATLMNVSFVVQGVLIAAGALLLRPALRGVAARLVTVLLCASGLGVLLVGLFPSDSAHTMHGIGAVLHLVGGGLGLIALAYGVRPRSEALGTALALLGLVATAATVFYLAGVVDLVGEGGIERFAAYPIPIGLALTAAGLWRMGGGAGEADGGSTRRERKEQERLARAELDRQRDEALEAAVGRRPPTLGDPEPSATSLDDEDDIDPEDPWSRPVRRREG
jgi:hypothetical membrane protein